MPQFETVTCNCRVPSSMALETESASFDLQKPAPIVDVVPPIPRSEEDEQRRLRYNDPSGARSGEWAKILLLEYTPHSV